MAKFLFDHSFDTQTGKRPPRTPARPTFSEEDLAAAEAQAYARGQAAGQAAAQASIEAMAAQAMRVLAERFSACAKAQAAAFDQRRLEAADLAFRIAGKLAPALMEREPRAEIEALVSQCLAEHEGEPRIVIRAAAPAVEDLSPRIDQIAAQSGYAGRIVLLPDERITNADCRIEWADGGAERNTSALNALIEAAVARYIDAGRPASGGKTDG